VKRALWVIAAVTVGLVLFGVLLASAFPDGLARVAGDLGFAGRQSSVAAGSPFAGYETRFFHSRWAAQASAGVVGIVILYGFGVLFGRTLKRNK
jgi:hypothetical protein